MPSGRKRTASKSRESWTDKEDMELGFAGEEEHYSLNSSGTTHASDQQFSSLFSVTSTHDGSLAANEITKSGRMRKKTAKLIEMEEVDKLEKTPRKAEIGKAKKQKMPKSADQLSSHPTSVAPYLESPDFKTEPLPPLVIKNVFSGYDAELLLKSAISLDAGEKETLKLTKARPKKLKGAGDATFGAVVRTSGLRELGEIPADSEADFSNHMISSPPQFGDNDISPVAKKSSKKKGNLDPPRITIKLETPAEHLTAGACVVKPEIMAGGDMSVSLSSSFPAESLPRPLPGLVIKEELDDGNGMNDMVVVIQPEKQKRKEKTDRVIKMEPLEPIEEIQPLTHMSVMRVNKKKKLKIGKQLKKTRKDPEKPKKKRQKGYTAYMLWCSVQRTKVVAQNPGIDFAQISKRLGDMWQTVPEKEKMTWRRKARRMAKKGSSLIKTGGSLKDDLAFVEMGHKKMLYNAKSFRPKIRVIDDPMTKVTGIDNVDVAAHLKLLGESLTTIGDRLQEHGGNIAVQGSLSVLLDSLICTLGPLMCLANEVPQLKGCVPEEVHRSTLDNIADIMMPLVG